MKDYDKAIELDSDYSDAYNNRGIVKNILGKYEEAIKDYDKAIELNPNNGAFYNNRGVSKENLEEYNEALKDYKKALELDPNYDTARENIKEIQDKYGLK
ncbi:tetratricopeptide repeat protein [uncultured Brachyspira sp.]|uniref:tetratricopeptide repeat protein n=1 Tax=uncultured Brachyspira sp. TaxID=221953 RepID=UPI0025980FD8|nr:tetratricopeptide repeat protein [uncultured Brachyspira sp.]